MTRMQGAGVVFISNNKIGLGLRGPDVPAPLMWGSIGGKSEKGETIIQTAAREVNEEIGIILDQSKIQHVDLFIESNGFIYTTFRYDIDESYLLDKFIKTPEIIDLRFFKLNELPENLLIAKTTLELALSDKIFLDI